VVNHNFDGNSVQDLKRIHGVHLPILILCGSKDKVILPVNSETMADLLGLDTFFEIVNAGHHLVHDCPNLLIEQLRNVFNKGETRIN